MSGYPNNYPQGGQTFQRPVKKRKHRFLKVVAILLVITVLSMTVVNYFFEPAFISRLSKGVIFGFHTKQVTVNELEDTQSIRKPTAKEIEDFRKFAKNYSNRVYLSLSSEEKEDFNEIKDGAKKLSAYKRNIQLGQNPFDNDLFAASFTGKSEPSTGMTSYLNFDLASVALGSSNTNSAGTDKEYEEIFDPVTLNQISTILYANGYPDLAAAACSMAAAVYPDDPMSALTFATILREGNADEDAFNVLQYALRLDPESEPILYSLGMCALDLRNTPYAETCFFKILSLNPSSGPGHQGMMLCYMDTGSYSSAFLHMLEGAREGYTTMVTETYKALRQNPDEYMEIAKSILSQYTFEQLLDFSKSRTPFDDTLDTPEGQLEIPRKINLGTDSTDVYAAAGKMQDGLQYAMTALSHAKATYGDAFSMIPSGELGELIGGLGGLLGLNADKAPDEMLQPVSKSILDKIFGSAASGATVSSDGWLSISYEQETFWMNILDDYVQIKLDELIEEHFEKPYDEVFENEDSVTPSLDKFHESFDMLCQSNPIQAANTVLNNLMNNNSVYDAGVQKADKKDMDKFLEAVNPKLEEGYKKTADLMELYWLHSGSILGQIGNDETYNRYQQHRKTVVASALTPYVLAGSINCFMVTMNFIGVDSDNRGSGASITYPQFPNFPDSQMGNPYVPPKPQPKEPDANEPPAEGPAQEENASGQLESSGQQETPGSGSPDNPAAPGSEKPKEGEITTEKTITIFIGPLSITINENSYYEVDLTAGGSVNVRVDYKTGNVTIFGGAGASLGAATSGASARAGLYATIDVLYMRLLDSGTRTTLEGQLAGNGMGVERQFSFATGADTTTVTAILLHQKSSQTINN